MVVQHALATRMADTSRVDGCTLLRQNVSALIRIDELTCGKRAYQIYRNFLTRNCKLRRVTKKYCGNAASLLNGHTPAELLLCKLDKCPAVVIRGLIQRKLLDWRVQHVLANE